MAQISNVASNDKKVRPVEFVCDEPLAIFGELLGDPGSSAARHAR